METGIIFVILMMLEDWFMWLMGKLSVPFWRAFGIVVIMILLFWKQAIAFLRILLSKVGL